MLWIILSVAAALIWAALNMVDKYVMTKWVDEPFVPVIIMGWVGLITGIAIFLTRGFSALSPNLTILALFSGVIYSIVVYLYFKAVSMEEISRIVPLFFLSPLFVLIIAGIFIGEIFGAKEYLGIILLVAGAVAVSAKNIRKMRFGTAFWLVILATIIMAVQNTMVKYLLDFADYWTVFSWTRIGSAIALIPFYFTHFRDLRKTVQKHGKKSLAVITLNESMNLVAVLLVTIAASIGYVTLVNAISSVQAFFVLLFVVILSIFYPKILKEEIGRGTLARKVFAVVIMFIGAILVAR